MIALLPLGGLSSEEAPFFGGDNNTEEDEGTPFGEPEDTSKPAQQPEKPQPAEAKPEGPKLLSNKQMMEMVRAYVSSQKVPHKTFGKGAFRIMLVGGQTGLDPQAMIQAAQTAMVGLDTWTGKTGILPLDRTADDLCTWVVILENKQRFDHFLKEVRKKHPSMRHNGEGEDLTAQLRTMNLGRVTITNADKVVPGNSIHYAIYTAANQAIDTFFSERGVERHYRPAWLREGLNAELQRLIPEQKDLVLWRTIAYENSKGGAVEDWNKALAKAIKEKDRQLYNASGIMTSELISLPAINYIQLWSFTKYLVAQGRSQKGEKNKMHQLLVKLGEGRDSEKAVHEVFKKKEPGLSSAWLRWAMSQ